ncbi:MAG: redoxin domain-containing protein [Planctomycetaceae bacterium]|jgi:thiol-disulfide isomerase/thioredoxin|nr:redoxin domain-containing protein [Planctomycetaceae bacterium]
MQKSWLIWLAAGALVGLPAALAQTQEKKGETPPVEAPKTEVLKLGSTVAETLVMRDLDGKQISFKELRGKVVIVHFWSDRCPAEKHADPVVKKLEEHYKGKDVVIVGIASNQGELGEEPAKDTTDFSKHYTNLREKAAKVGYTHKIYIDHGNKLSELFQAKTTPHCYVIDAKGVLRYTGALDDDLSESKGEAATVYVRDAADALLAGKEVKVAETRSYG